MKDQHDAFEAIDADRRIVPSLVWTPQQLEAAIASDGSMFDSIVVTDVNSADMAIGILVLLSECVIPAVKHSISEMRSSLPESHNSSRKRGRAQSSES